MCASVCVHSRVPGGGGERGTCPSILICFGLQKGFLNLLKKSVNSNFS